MAWDKLRDAVRAVDAMGGARMLLPDDTALCEAQLALLAEAGMFEQAEALLPGYDALLERNGQGADRHRVSFLRGQWLLARGELAAGRVVLEESFEMNGTSIPTILALGALLRQLGERVCRLKENVKTEEATKNALIMPFLQALGYDVFNPLEIVPEICHRCWNKEG